MLLGSRLKEARRKAGLTQSELGKKVGVSKSAICSYEKETRNPTLDTIYDFVEVLGVPSDYLIGADVIVQIDETPQHRALTKEEMKFIEILRKDEVIYEMLFEDGKRGSDLVKQKLS